jgi:hypothetical protein
MSIVDLSAARRDPGPFPPDRRCVHADESGTRCITRLHTSHAGDLCYAHALPEPATLVESREDFAELMSEAA